MESKNDKFDENRRLSRMAGPPNEPSITAQQLSPFENFFKIEDHGTWYYISVVGVVMARGSINPGDEDDKGGRYEIINGQKWPNQYWSKNLDFVAPLLPQLGDTCPLWNYRK